jgi:excisionase family DNA binding protein
MANARGGQMNHPQLPDKAEALAYRISDVPRVARIGRTRTYQLISEGKLRAVKCGRRTLIEADSLHAYLANLPAVPSKTAA